MSRISIAMATFNGAGYLQAQLDSFLAQTRLPDELVIVDDLSDDGTLELAQGFVHRAPFDVRIAVNSMRLGPCGNFNRALTLCTGDIVLPGDQDDVWFPEKLATLERLAACSGAVACWMVDACLTDAGLRPTGKSKMGQIRAAGLPQTAMVMGCCAAFRRNLLEILLPIPVDEPAHDGWMIGVADLLSVVERHEIPLQYYRRHGRNVSQVAVNRIEPVSVGERMRGIAHRSARRVLSGDGLEREHRFMVNAATRLEQRSEDVHALLGPRAKFAIEATRARLDVLSRRKAIRALPRWQRPTAVGALWRTGGYRQSGGARGAIKDSLLPHHNEPADT